MSTLLPYRPKAKQVVFGLEVPSGLTYQGWEPGREYTKILTLKNVHLKTQKIRYQISSNRFSSGFYPQPLVLSAGTSYTLPITFRPSEKCPYEEFIQIETGEGAFKVPIMAQLPQPEIALPDSLRFGMCAVQERVSVNFEICNIGNMPAKFSWKLLDGFQISPESGVLAVKQSSKMTAKFSPQTAVVYNSLAVCTFSSANHKQDSDSYCALVSVGESRTDFEVFKQTKKVMKLEGIGKYPHVTVRLCSSECPLSTETQELKLKGTRKMGKAKLSSSMDSTGAAITGSDSEGCKNLSNVTVDFGSVAVGTVAERWIEIINVSPVSLTFDLMPTSGSSKSIPVYTSTEFKGSLQPNGTRRIKLLYSPRVVTQYSSVGYFILKAVGGLGKCTITCKGSPKGPEVLIEEAVVNFGTVETSKTVSRVVHIRNNSNVPTTFQFQLDPDSVFQCNTLSSELGPLSSQTLIVKFTPQHTIPYCRRVICLVNNHDPLFTFFIGTCFSETVRPVCIQPSHLCNYLEHAKTGLSRLPPEQLDWFLKRGQISAEGPDGSLIPTNTSDDLPPPATPLTSRTTTYAHYMQLEHEPSVIAHVSTDVEVVKFGYCPPHRTSDSKHVSVTNHTMGTVRCVWMTSPPGAAESFAISPVEREIEPSMTASFSFCYTPRVSNQLYFREIECFVFFKGLQDFQNIDPLTITPPWCLTVRVSGHTFAPGIEVFQPRLMFDTKNLEFPPSVPGQHVYQTTLFKNVGNTPVLFDITQNPSQPFLVKPSHGFLKEGYQLLILQMVPREAKLYKYVLNCQLNASQLLSEEILLSGSGESPTIRLENEGELFFKPTCVGSTSSVSYGITNLSQLPVRFKWRVDNPVNNVDIVKVDPKSAIIQPNERQTHSWYFSPTSCKQFTLKAVLMSTIQMISIQSFGDLLQDPVSAPCTRKKSVINIHGLGTSGIIKCTPTSIESGTVIIGTSNHHKLTLYNPSPDSLHYKLSMVCDVKEKDRCSTDSEGTILSNESSDIGYNIVELNPVEGVLPACSTEHLKIVVRPSIPSDYSCTIQYQLINKNTENKSASVCKSPELVDLCDLTVSGAYPSLSIVDVQGVGVANRYSKADLWNILNIDRINDYLLYEPSLSELQYEIGTRHSITRRVPIMTKAIVDFDFGAAPLNSGSSVVHLMLENKGKVPTDWTFQFPLDVYVEPEYWANSSQLDDIEQNEADIIDNELFTVKPKGGTLVPGQVITVVACFKHTHTGASKLPILLKINRGREILLNWNGVTVEPGHPYIHFTSQCHRFTPVPIGAQAHPRQTYTLRNVGESVAEYKIDTRPLEELKQNNYLMPVLECLNPEGVIPPEANVPVKFVFSPLEAKRYMVDLPIHLSSGDIVFVNFSGEGYHNQDLVNDHKEAASSQNIQKILPHRCIAIPGELAHLSQQSMDFGCMPLFSAVRRLMFVSNLSKHTLSFHWNLGANIADEVVSLQPMDGYIQPGESAAVKVTFCSHSSPSIYNLDLICQVVDETEMLMYQSQLTEWKRSEEEKKYIFTITQDSEEQRQAKVTKRPQSTSKLKSIPGNLAVKSSGTKSPRALTTDSDLLRGKLSALPPIGVTEETYEEWKKRDLSMKKKTRPRAKQTSDNKPPTPPSSLFLHLDVTAQTAAIPDYATHNSDLASFYMDNQSLIAGCDVRRVKKLEKLRVETEEKEVVGNVLCQMIRELLDDSNFQCAIKHIVEEPIPYFTQLSSHVGDQSSVQQFTLINTSESQLESSLHPQHTHHPLTSSQLSATCDDVVPGEDLGVTPIVMSESDVEECSIRQEETDNNALNSKINLLPEFTSLVEAVLENTVLNILKEAASGEMKITAPIYTTIAQTLDK